MNEPLIPSDGLLTFRNSQGLESRGTLMSLTRQSVVFELYNPYSIVQLSEVLADLAIRRGNRRIYQGRAVVSNLVSTGLMIIVSATLVDPWSDLSQLTPGESLRNEVGTFVDDWHRANDSIQPAYRVIIGTIRGFLEDFSKWLSQGESVAGLSGRDMTNRQMQDFTGDIEAVVLPKLHQLFTTFERIASEIPGDQVEVHKAFARREIHPLILCSPYMHRTFTKPLGYAGDYEMVNMMCRDRWEGNSTYARIINAIVIESDGARAHRNRIDQLIRYLEQEGSRVAAQNRPLRVLNIACGPAVEVQRFIRSSPLADHTIFHLLDFNAETLDYTRGRIHEAVKASGRLPGLEFIHKSIHDLLQEARGRKETEPPTYDLVYCAGLFDYLSDRVCQRLMELFTRWALPGSLIVSTNVHPGNPVRFFIEHFLEWNLVYRDNQQMEALAPPGHQARVIAESTGVNIFLEVRKASSQ